ncbi:MAG: ribosome maturation factor RimP [Actinobacteria bacterium]|nr:ribosome maturation factor RimP [Actinomycetota bacterium]
MTDRPASLVDSASSVSSGGEQRSPSPPQALVDAVEPVLSRLGLELYDLELVGRPPSRILRITIDRAGGGSADRRSTESSPATATNVGEGGVDLDAITATTEALSPILDHDPAAEAVLRGAYTLEVTSPGLERSLRTPDHFRRAIGTTVSVKTGAGADAQRRRGTLVGADDASLDLDVDGTREHIAYADVIQARTVFEWGSASTPKRGKRQKVST